MASRPNDPRQADAEVLAEDDWHQLEASAMLEMAMLRQQIPVQSNSQVDLNTQEGMDATIKFLRYLVKAGRVLQIQPGPRTYRESFPENIIAPWTDGESPYSVKLLIVSVQHWRNLVLNNQVFRLGEEIVLLSRKLCRKWAVLGGLLRKFRKHGPPAVPKKTVVAALEAFDGAWMDFEQKFISELQVMETEAQNPLAPVVQASEQVCSLKRYVASFDPVAKGEIMDDPEYQERQKQLVETIARMNLVASPHHKGYCFTVETLNELKAVIEQCKIDQPDPEQRKNNPSFTLAMNAVEAFNCLCTYFYHVRNFMDRVDPNLRNNKGLVKRLSHWEATWFDAENHVLDPLGRQAFETLTLSIQRAHIVSPELAEMCEEFSADMFLVLPRLIWLSFLAHPEEMTPEIQCHLSHRFVEVRSSQGDVGCSPGNELKELQENYKRVLDLVASAVANEALEDPEVQKGASVIGFDEAKKQIAHGILSRSAVLGSGGDLEKYATLFSQNATGAEAREACEAFVRSLEGWSLELQRHNASSWNKFVSVVVSCLENKNGPMASVENAFDI